MTCANCTHYHDNGDQLLCDKGIMEVRRIGLPHVVVSMPYCYSFDKIHPTMWSDDDLEAIRVDEEKRLAKLDKRTKAYRDRK